MSGKQRYHLFVLALTTAVLLVAQVLSVSEQALSLGSYDFPAVCATRRWLSIACPTCGLTRAFVAAAQGQWALSWALHMGGVAAFLVVAAQVPLRLLWLRREKEVKA